MKSIVFVLGMLLVAGMGYAQEKKAESVRLYVSGMHCENCVDEVTDALQEVKGVSGVKVSLKDKIADVTLASNTAVSTDNLIKAVTDAGFTASTTKPAKDAKVEPKKMGKEGKDGKECEDESGDCCKKKEVKKETKKS
ncbi:MAG: heavy-metal-associated domain-containing protein [Bacteroidota bacterium]